MSLVISTLNGSTVCFIIALSPRWLRFYLVRNKPILPNQQGFFYLFSLKITTNRGVWGKMDVIDIDVWNDIITHLNFSLKRHHNSLKLFINFAIDYVKIVRASLDRRRKGAAKKEQ